MAMNNNLFLSPPTLPPLLTLSVNHENHDVLFIYSILLYQEYVSSIVPLALCILKINV